LGPEELKIDLGLVVPCKIYVTIISLLFAFFLITEEISNSSTATSKAIRKHLGHHDYHEFLAQQSIQMKLPYDDEVAECDYKTMTAKRFFNDYVK